MTDAFRTVAARSEFRHKIQRSEFFGIVFPVTADDAFFAELAAIERQWFDATHHCWAFRLFAGGATRQRSSDAGEPSGTAGRPILSAIEGADLLDVAVVVVRWFGGVKLGSGGLSRAYRDTAAAAISTSSTVERFVYERFTVGVPFEKLNAVYRLVDPPAVVLAEERFEGSNEFDLDVRRSRADDFARLLAERRLAFSRDATPRLR